MAVEASKPTLRGPVQFQTHVWAGSVSGGTSSSQGVRVLSPHGRTLLVTQSCPAHGRILLGTQSCPAHGRILLGTQSCLAFATPFTEAHSLLQGILRPRDRAGSPALRADSFPSEPPGKSRQKEPVKGQRARCVTCSFVHECLGVPFS